jgi:uncharacterized protein YndB with AHSA1/START domain
MRSISMMTALATLCCVAPTHAEVVDSRAEGFEVTEHVTIDAPATLVWRGLSRIGAWWESKHTFSQDAANLSLRLEPGGCFCEALPDGGGVRHMTVVFARPKETARLEGALGPLQASGATGHLTWTLNETAGKTVLTQTYDVGGYVKGGLESWAPTVDAVLGKQLIRLKAYVESTKARRDATVAPRHERGDG